MKLKYINLMAAALFALSACQPDEYSLGAKSLTPDDLAEGIAFDYTSSSMRSEAILRRRK